MPAPLKLQKPRTLRGGLASVSEDLSAQLSVEEWRTGVQYTTKCDVDSFIWGCSGGANEDDDETFDADKNETDAPDQFPNDFYPATIGVTDECMIAGRQTVIGDIVKQTATYGLDRVRYSTLAEILYYGNVGTAGRLNAGLKNVATVVGDPSAPADLATTLRNLLESACRCWDQQLVFHVPVAYLPYFLESTLVTFDEASGNYLFGAHKVSFDCYVNQGPAGEFDAEPADDGSEVWIYVTSTPLIGLDKVDVQSSILDPRKNLYRVVAEQGAILVFDPCCAVGAKALVTEPAAS